MGYSSPKKQLDLKEFLSTPAKKRPGGKGFSYRKYDAPKAQPAEAASEKPDDKDS
ncbi:hypothetical protein [Salipiger mucosus]|uniref:Uncharacterized protein n=1 Tax=Salipiger mucosus DSM 16094 TaxID=1123237 RepID=S9QLP8_9RHOB|nr:hypothetical protein [Salipiger mucosus]EPX80513.1 hypothetical protein Salmuc_03830 [Salipiger mucosus DSM 16094]